jgi:hypothetical protein
MRQVQLKPTVVVPYTVHWVESGRIFASRGLSVLESRDHGRSWKLVCHIPGWSKRILAATRLSRRLLRTGIHHVQPFGESKLVIVANDFVQAFDLERSRFLPPAKISGSRPLVISTTPLSILYGEYSSNPQRRSVGVHASLDGIEWRRAISLHGVRHIHAVQWDPYERKVWITTGDEDHESAIWRADELFQSLERVIGGSQQHRAVQLVFSEKAIYFATDAPSQDNYIYRMDRASREVTRLAPVKGPVFYGCNVADNIFLATVCEPTDKSRNRIATVWVGNESPDSWRPILRFRKDSWPMRLFQYGQVKFPAGRNDGPYLWLTPFATELDQQSLAFDVRDLL